MSEQGKVNIRKLPTGVPGLDEILGGGLPEFSFNVIAGSPGTGKTTLAHQIVFANATPEKPALYFTVLGEPAMKMLRYQQQYTFFDPAKLNTAIRFINLSQFVSEKGLNAVLDEIARQVEAASPGMVVVDSFRSVIRRAQAGGRRNGTPGVCSAVGPVSDELAGNDLSARRVYRGGDPGQSRIHRCRRPLLALSAC